MFARMRVKCISGVAVRSQPVTTESNVDQGSSRLNAAFVSNNSKRRKNCTAFLSCESMTNKNVETCLFFHDGRFFFGYAMSVRLDKTTESWRVSQFSFHVRMFMSFGHDLGFIWNPWVHGPYDSGVCAAEKLCSSLG